MTLNILDENGKAVTESNPIIIEHNGTTGDTVILPLTLVNISANHYYRNVNMQINDIPPISSALIIQGEKPPNKPHEKYIRRLNPKERVSFSLKSTVPPNTSERVVKGVSIKIIGMKYPLP